MPSREVTTRDAGLALISRINRWLIAGAVGLAGLLSLVAAHAFNGHTAGSAASSSAAAQSQSQAPPQPQDSQGSGLQAPAQAPAPAPAPAPAATSGGS